ncbi:PBSX family phage terminase large subunit [Acinetobacter sp. ME22]|uniref:PBSX family phage terminase large subunit n=1 Tax=Acinetobacter sp. ME22 TaxID=2904802 RepID=UPI001EDC1541|nr:PBSX family phage terminase large subunit [Acinetobacter sp. ME22]MCG2572345.1 PBSX family phage terminase large subunit [Acinetobacter sp. ME22]
MGVPIQATLNPVLEAFWLMPARNKVLYGGRASSKSWDAAGFAIFLADNYKLRILCARQFQNKIEESVYSLLKIQIERFGLKHRFEILKNKIINKYTGTEFMFYGLWRNIDEVKSLESIDICWLEEAHNISKEQWEILEPTIRKDYSQFWIVFNPKLANDFVYKRFVLKPPPKTISRLINYLENPFLSQTMLDVINAAKEEDYDDYAHIYLGVPRDDDDDVVIKRSWLMAAVDAHTVLKFKPEGIKRLGFDVADGGADKCANVQTHGSVLQWTDEWKAREDELLQSCTRTYTRAVLENSQIIYDSIGVGAGAGAKFQELNEAQNRHIRYSKFVAGGKVWQPDSKYRGTDMYNKDMFNNLKAQSWWSLADRLRNTYNAVRNGQQFNVEELMAFDSSCPNLEKLMDELSTPRRQYGADGKVKVEGKEELAKRGIPSPNLADAAIMSTTPAVSSYGLLD